MCSSTDRNAMVNLSSDKTTDEALQISSGEACWDRNEGKNPLCFEFQKHKRLKIILGLLASFKVYNEPESVHGSFVAYTQLLLFFFYWITEEGNKEINMLLRCLRIHFIFKKKSRAR